MPRGLAATAWAIDRMDERTGPVPSPLGTTRARFLRSVRNALGGTTAGTPAPPDVDDALTRLCHSDEDLPARFATGAETVGMQVHRVTAATMIDCLTRLLDEHGVRSCVVGMADAAAAAPIRDLLSGRGVVEPDWRADGGVAQSKAAVCHFDTIMCKGKAKDLRSFRRVPFI